MAEYYAATGKTSGLTLEDLARPDVAGFVKSVESAVVHYGDTTLTFLNNWYRADARGTALTYTSAVAVEEKSVIDYNSGNPDGELSTGRSAPPAECPPRRHLPEGRHALLRQPAFILDAHWVTPSSGRAPSCSRTTCCGRRTRRRC